MVAKKLKIVQKLVLIIPIIILIVLNLIAVSIFGKSEQDNYEKAKMETTFTVRLITHEIEASMIRFEQEEMTPQQEYSLRTVVEDINKRSGTYSLILDSELKILPGLSYREDTLMIEFKKALQDSIAEGRIFDYANHPNGDYVNITAGGCTFEVYWVAIPLDHTQYYVLSAVNRAALEESKAVVVCKNFISTLNILLTVCMYTIIILYDKVDEKVHIVSRQSTKA